MVFRVYSILIQSPMFWNTLLLLRNPGIPGPGFPKEKSSRALDFPESPWFRGPHGFSGLQGFQDPLVSRAPGLPGPPGFQDPKVSRTPWFPGPQGFQGPGFSRAPGFRGPPEFQGPKVSRTPWAPSAAQSGVFLLIALIL